MKWKRSKKAQQEAKGSKEGSGGETQSKAQASPNAATTKPNNGQSQEGQVTENQGSARKVQEGESLYRPYVV